LLLILTVLYWFKKSIKNLFLNHLQIKYFEISILFAGYSILSFIVDKTFATSIVGLISLQYKLHLVNGTRKKAQLMAK
jgi:hypothetical protein